MKSAKGQNNWSDDDQRYLLKWAGIKSREEIAADLGIEPSRVTSRARNQLISLRVKAA